MSGNSNSCLKGVRVLAAINGLELFGHERGNIEVFKALRSMGGEIRVGVNARDDGGQVAAELHRLGLETFPVSFGPQWSIQWAKKDPSIAFSNVWSVFSASKAVLDQVRAFRPTHFHLGSPLAYSFIAIALARVRIPLIYRLGDCPPVDSLFNLWIWHMAMRRANHVVAISEFVRRAAIRTGLLPEKTSQIYNVAPFSRDVKKSCPDGHALPSEVRESVVYVGAVSEHKGLVPLIEAFAVLAVERPCLRLEIVGGSVYDREFRGRLIELIRNLNLLKKVTLHGHVGAPGRHFRDAHIHVAPSLCEEGLGNVVLEAKRQGTPSVIFPSGGLPEMVRHQVDGFICKDKSVPALIEALRWMFADRDRLHAMGDSALEDHETRFGEAHFAQQWSEVYLSASEQSKNGKVTDQVSL